MRPGTAMRAWLVIAGCALMWLAGPSSASAHASLSSATPQWEARLTSAPRALRLVFDEDVVPRYVHVAVVSANGPDLAGAPRVAGTVVTVPLRPGPVGSYTVRWRAVSSDDGHATQGAYTYGVGVKPLAPAAAPGLDIPVAPQVLAWLQFLGIVLAGGMLSVRALLWTPAARSLGEAGAPDAGAAAWAAMAGAVLALHAGVLAFLVSAYPIVGGGLSNFVHTEIAPIRTGTHVGQAWTLTTFAWLGVLGLIVAAWTTPRRRERLLGFAGALALAIAFGLSWASHPASRGTAALVVDYLHLLAAALWVGGLVALVIVAAAARSLPRSAREAIARTCILRFSRIALPAVAVVGLAGLYLALRQLPGPSAVLTSGYGVTLLAKTSVAIAALALGGYHRRFVVPRLATGEPVGTIRRTLVLELGSLLIVLALAAVVSQTAPPS